MNRTKSCEDRIDAELKHELEQVEKALQVKVERFTIECLECGLTWESEDEFEECPECGNADTSTGIRDASDDEYGLLCPPYIEDIVVKVERSCGGPQDYWRLYLDPEDGEIVKASYSYLDWFDGAVRWLNADQLKLVAELFQEDVRWLVTER